MYWKEPVVAMNDASPNNLTPPAEINKLPPIFEIVVFGSPIISDCILIDPEETYISANGNSKVPNVAPLGDNGTIFPPNVVVPEIDNAPDMT
jgi:hypothetical protein